VDQSRCHGLRTWLPLGCSLWVRARCL
jgi:hypothetical protein